MNRPIKNALAAALIGLSIGPATLLAEPDNAQEVTMVALPIEGPLYMRETAQGTPVIISADGRFVMPGRLVDRANDHNMIMSLADAQEAFGETASAEDNSNGESRKGAVSQSPRLNVDQLLSFTVGEVGEGREEVFVWIDPTCPHCHTVLKMQPELTDRYVFHNLLIPVLGPNAEMLVNDLVCANETERRNAVLARDRAVVKQDKCYDDQLRNNRRLATELNIDSVPVVITPDNRMAAGAPRTVAAFKQFLENK